jgi:hypothetical protein
MAEENRQYFTKRLIDESVGAHDSIILAKLPDFHLKIFSWLHAFKYWVSWRKNVGFLSRPVGE